MKMVESQRETVWRVYFIVIQLRDHGMRVRRRWWERVIN